MRFWLNRVKFTTLYPATSMPGIVCPVAVVEYVSRLLVYWNSKLAKIFFVHKSGH